MVKELQTVLDAHGVPAVEWYECLREGDRTLTELDREQPDGTVRTPLSDTIMDHCFPRADSSLEYVHFTSLPKLENMLRSGEWWLACVLKRIQEHEYTTFCNDHGLGGYLQNDPVTGRPKYETNCRDLFYTSLTRDPNPDEAQLWAGFGDGGQGVKVFVRLTPVARRAEIRPVRYQQPHLRTVLQDLMQAARASFGKELVIRGIARMGAFYLPFGSYGHERETRVLVKRHPIPPGIANPFQTIRQAGPLHHVPGPLEYLPLPLNRENPFCRIDLVRLDPGPNCDVRALRAMLKRYPNFRYLMPRRGCNPLGWFM